MPSSKNKAKSVDKSTRVPPTISLNLFTSTLWDKQQQRRAQPTNLTRVGLKQIMLLVNGMVMQLEHVHIPEALSAALHRNSLLPSLDANAVLWNDELLFTDRFLPLDRLPKVVQDFVGGLGFAPFNDGELHQDLNDPQPNFLQVVEEKRPKQVPVHDDVVKVIVELLGVGHGFLYLLTKSY